MSTTQKIIFVRESKTVMNRSIVNEFIDSGDFEDFEVFKTNVLDDNREPHSDELAPGEALAEIVAINEWFAERGYN